MIRSNLWLVTFSDLVTLLLAFFVLHAAIAKSGIVLAKHSQDGPRELGAKEPERFTFEIGLGVESFERGAQLKPEELEKLRKYGLQEGVEVVELHACRTESGGFNARELVKFGRQTFDKVSLELESLNEHCEVLKDNTLLRVVFR